MRVAHNTNLVQRKHWKRCNLTKQIQVSEAVHNKLEAALKEIEQEFILLRFKWGAPIGKHKNVIRDIPYVGILPLNKARDARFHLEIQNKIANFQRLLRYTPEQVTTKRVAALRQKFFMLQYQNQNPGTYHGSRWCVSSGKYFAGKFLTGIFDKHISLLDRKDV